ncbi:MAG: branched-chain amino acid ABC transporter permease [Chloroflexota bacterium]|nr:branched-chain amino acid ABC transporter permease [Chloroflexota bacterium]
MSIYITSFGFGLITASILALASVGLTLQYGVTNVFNFAFGGTMTFGAFTAFNVNSFLHQNIWISMAVAVIATGLLSVALNEFLFQPFIRRGLRLFDLMVVAFAISIVLQNVILALSGPDIFSYILPTAQPVTFGDFLFTTTQLLIIGVAALAVLCVHLLLRYTKIGKAMRASADDSDLARLSGINTRMIVNIAWFVSGGLAGIAGVVLAMNSTSFDAQLGQNFLLLTIAAVILGGIGKPYGAMVAALIVGIATEEAAVIIGAQYELVVALIAVVIVLLIRPQGLLSLRTRGAQA